MVVKGYVIVWDVAKTVEARKLLSFTPHRTKESNSYSFVSFKFPVLHVPVKSAIVNLFFCGVHIRCSLLLLEFIGSRILALAGVFEYPVWRHWFAFERNLLSRYRRRGFLRLVLVVQVTRWLSAESY